MNIPERFWKVSTGLVGVLIALAAVFIVKELKVIGYVGANPNQTNTITVDGTGDAFGAPDVATFSFTVTETAKTVAAAQAAATDKNNAAVKALKDAGVADKDVQTTSYNITPHYESQGATVCTNTYCPPVKSVLTGYDVSQTTSVKVRDLSKAGDLFTSVGGLGVQNVSDFAFAIDNPDAINAEARSKAISDAQSKADTLARQLGVRLVRIVSFNENNNRPYPLAYGIGGMKAETSMAAPVAPDVNPGQQKVTDNVQITYEIE